jgi:hypothetical protein
MKVRITSGKNLQCRVYGNESIIVEIGNIRSAVCTNRRYDRAYRGYKDAHDSTVENAFPGYARINRPRDNSSGYDIEIQAPKDYR